MNTWIGRGAIAALLVSVAFGVLYLGEPRSRYEPKPPKIHDIKGRLYVLTANAFNVNGTSVILCGVRPSGQPALLATNAVRLAYEKAYVKCTPVGGGTPCDGKTVATIGLSKVAQCKVDGTLDLAAALIDAGILCGTVPAYKPC
ncbi:hypothetical protein [Mesorhizobium sp. M0578]|uniref:hypothetical protein n=1 Tax=unclassified Mesorhizobium TaxID=325217 RepID=UPI00333BD648